ncbi:hypothetical protein VK792_02005 [Mesobacterium sp. TK19101]|uniref:Uncharacterized protein n=1 Tax=Mesobacterium hydrothermale TaxID=3111907 RepID=A0ABU6HC58_9RHOB|nr:hypothetical protein [Mesobacterium sp. TK19101]MEC3860047.1 hypothetical protein [Mesobacterium sp. TK19101]
MTLAPRTFNPMQGYAAGEALQTVRDFGANGLRSTFARCIQEGQDGNFDIIELEQGAAALTIVAVAHGAAVVGADTVRAALDRATLDRVRDDTPLDEVRATRDVLGHEIKAGLLEYLGTDPEVAAGYRRTMATLSDTIDTMGVPA